MDNQPGQHKKAISQLNFLTRLVFSFVTSLAVLWPTSPWYYPFPTRDSGVFLYTGWRILNGEIPYLQVWDHKPPLVYLINAIGLGLSGESFWGVWLVRLFCLAFAVYILFLLLEKYFGTLVAILTSIVWVSNLPPILGQGNFTTEYTIPLQALALFLVALAFEKRDKPFPRYFMIGILGGLAFLTKQTSIGIWLAIGLFLIIDTVTKKKFKSNFLRFSGLAAGSLLVIALTFVGFNLLKALPEFWDQAFSFNFAYVSPGETSFFNRLFQAINPAELGSIALYYLGGFGAITGIFIYLNRSKQSKLTTLHGLILVGQLDLLFESLLTNLAYDTFEHYYLTFIPILTFFCGLLLSQLSEFKIWDVKNKKVHQRGFLILITLFSIFPLINTWKTSLTKPDYHVNEMVIKYVLDQTEPDDPILIWGAETTINFYTKRAAPTRYVYQYPLLVLGYATQQKVLEFFDDLLENPPEILVDSNRSDMPFFIFAVESELIEEKKHALLSLYTQVPDIDGWKIYQLSGSNP